ncbi:hypothetical protein MCOR27_001050 [Pyricularia oryzae]|uniref:Smr domain-containing protein n=2 Tax=Pyricularia TaxID=48558 RepID=A0ABQ8NXP1_PYRGI|nr:hypothetical protein MCOR01_007261 [Pyricularia oryzae]KAI6303603.1 hypothetical protein MCOR33_001296 [Pyricularia grisea]KAH9434148.1 hypothetical protein MCOR02_006171 [Pyricularia oryzae]KAI6261675.1 hypothetical protein MCOR19_002122 [Pyricularia oryzae]KAI6277634.1 hypothetical protein MCOR26_005025 [Pyricularia oryzae]
MSATTLEGSTSPDALAGLLDDFRPFLEESLILAIVGDYDLTTQADAARGTLQLLASDAEKEETSTFNPSGIALDAVLSESADHRASVLGSTRTDETPWLSSATSESPPPDAEDGPWDEGQDVPEDEKEATLIAMFPEMKVFDVKFELQRANGDFEKAMLALLNIQYLDEAGELQRGTVVGTESPGVRSRKKAKGKKKATAPSNGAKSNLRLDVAYKLKPVSLDEPDEESSSTASPLRSPLYSPVSSGFASPTRSSPAPQASQQRKPPADPLSWQRVESRKSATPKNAPALISGLLSQDSSASLRDAAGHSFDQAHNAWRRGRSDPLFRTAAVVYSERGHSQVGAAQVRERADYEALVDRQSAGDPDLIDLHGVPVREGVEMALARTRRWWRRLVETEEHGVRAAARQRPFVVVTGSGNHSAGGVSRLRQSVGVALARDGWCVEAQTAKFVVSGRKRP